MEPKIYAYPYRAIAYQRVPIVTMRRIVCLKAPFYGYLFEMPRFASDSLWGNVLIQQGKEVGKQSFHIFITFFCIAVAHCRLWQIDLQGLNQSAITDKRICGYHVSWRGMPNLNRSMALQLLLLVSNAFKEFDFGTPLQLT